jgi:hypothetical protein
MALTKINNNTLSAITTLPAAIATGKVLQVVSTLSAVDTSTTGTTWVTSGLEASITPSSTSSKIFVKVSAPILAESLGTYASRYSIFRNNTTNLSLTAQGFGSFWRADGGYFSVDTCMDCLDSPSTTSSVTYTAYIKSEGNSTVTKLGAGSTSTITLMEIAG